MSKAQEQTAEERAQVKQRRAKDLAKLEKLKAIAWKFYEEHGTRHPHAGLVHNAVRKAFQWHAHQDSPGPGMTAAWVEGYLSSTTRMVETLVKDEGVRNAYLGVLSDTTNIILESYVGEESIQEAQRRFTAITMRGSVDR